MKKSGITRRIDELGRIVIPKEIRKNIHLKTGELLEIYLDNDNKIILTRHELISKNDTFLKEYIDSLAKSINANIYFTNLNKILFSSDKCFENKNISSSLENELLNGRNISKKKSIELTKDKMIESNFNTYTISPNADLLGVIIVEYKDYGHKHEDLLEFSKKFIERYFETN